MSNLSNNDKLRKKAHQFFMTRYRVEEKNDLIITVNDYTEALVREEKKEWLVSVENAEKAIQYLSKISNFKDEDYRTLIKYHEEAARACIRKGKKDGNEQDGYLKANSHYKTILNLLKQLEHDNKNSEKKKTKHKTQDSNTLFSKTKNSSANANKREIINSVSKSQSSHFPHK